MVRALLYHNNVKKKTDIDELGILPLADKGKFLENSFNCISAAR